MPTKLLSLLFLTIGVVLGDRNNRDHCSLLPHGGLPHGDPHLARELYPVRPTFDNWTTSEVFQKALPIDDEVFRSVNILSNTTRRVLEAPDGIVSLEGFYPNGSYTFTHDPRGGFSFYAPGPEDVDLTAAKEATFAYTILFPEGYEWVKGGKLPGFCTYMHSSFTSSPMTNAWLGSWGFGF